MSRSDEPNPFRDPGLFAGRQGELARLRDDVRAGESVVVIGGRRAGKTRLVEELGDVGRPLFRSRADGWRLGSERDAIAELGRALGADCTEREELEAALRQHVPLALVIDEADRLLSERWAHGFYAWLRYLDGTVFKQLVSFVLVGGPVLDGYENPEDRGSPVLNLASRHYLEPLDADARAELIGLLPDAPPVAEIVETVGGHPWLLTRLLRELWHDRDLRRARRRTFTNCRHAFEVWRRQLGPRGLAFLESLGSEGIASTAFDDDPRWRRAIDELTLSQHLCLVVEESDRIRPGPRLFLDWLDDQETRTHTYDLAISYASEDEDLARTIHDQLHDHFHVFFAPNALAWTWGRSLGQVLPHVYGVDAKYILVLSTEAYLHKHWTRVEYDAVREGKNGRLLLLDLGARPTDYPDDEIYIPGTPQELVRLVSLIKTRISEPDA